jgi:mono/diheme cytochrome c family protein
MKLILISPTARRRLAIGVVALACLAPTASSFGQDASKPAASSVDMDGKTVATANPAAISTPVSYSSAQSKRGKKKYKKECQECHGDNLKGGLNGGPPIRGLNFEKKFVGDVPAVALYAYISNAMPPNSPGRFSAKTYADLMAYVLNKNGFKAGAPLPTDYATLGKLMMKK